jgi:Fe-S oxidoreductase
VTQDSSDLERMSYWIGNDQLVTYNFTQTIKATEKHLENFGTFYSFSTTNPDVTISSKDAYAGCATALCVYYNQEID